MSELATTSTRTEPDSLDPTIRFAALAGLLLLLIIPLPALAQEATSEEAQAETQEPGDLDVGDEEDDSGFLERRIGDNWVLSPVIFPIYSPETEFALALGALATFSAQPLNPELPRSTVSLFAIPASNGSLGFNADLEGFFSDDSVRIQLELDYDDGVDNYWGVGYEAGDSVDQDEDVTEFDRVAFELPLVANFRIGPSLYLGVNFDLIDYKVLERSPTMEGDPDFETTGDEIRSVGAGLQLTYDSRDDTVNSYSGRYFDARATFYLPSMGSDQEFQAYELDYRQYHQIKRPGRTLAWQVFGRVTRGDVPWIRMSTVGSSADLRGYYQGRFRDKAAAWGLVEYRHMTHSKLFNWGRNGFAVWAGLGFIGEDFGDFGSHELPNFGVGYRLEVQPQRNLRIDVGVGKGEIELYLNFKEAF